MRGAKATREQLDQAATLRAERYLTLASAKHDDPPPSTAPWTHRYKASGQPAQYELYDQIWLSPALTEKQQEAWIDRRKRHTGDGSDHDPAWVVLEL